ncbi:hypothetical protein CEUSTIGMA_g267.t1 [Chlamydomonas eustigma]|uniref:Cilia- and flagella-associated protein 36 n=1 Tax=Chlamydomonas eustigma TaxID=1157962 RepID=A0A250WQ72_9CHLO|nr:hypothetical protein CEUSTIGMA_g267.t1 [Chlamydomonas eustigma]|eukprot:GAX72812.1 hypothetical protein CEUSTIGMA_g267.t1 [Chlamydomonas eustigma]
MDPSTMEFLDKLELFFSNPEFTTALHEFFTKNISDIEFKPIEEEQPLKNHDLYAQYTELVEKQLEAFMSEEGLSTQEVYGACQKALSYGETPWLMCLDYLLASTEYESFMELAYDHACMLGIGEAEDGEEGLPLEDEEHGANGEPDEDVDKSVIT